MKGTVFGMAGGKRSELLWVIYMYDAFWRFCAGSCFQRFDLFNQKYNPFGQACLRDVFLKTDNHIKGRVCVSLPYCICCSPVPRSRISFQSPLGPAFLLQAVFSQNWQRRLSQTWMTGSKASFIVWTVCFVYCNDVVKLWITVGSYERLAFHLLHRERIL